MDKYCLFLCNMVIVLAFFSLRALLHPWPHWCSYCMMGLHYIQWKDCWKSRFWKVLLCGPQ